MPFSNRLWTKNAQITLKKKVDYGDERSPTVVQIKNYE